MNNLDKLEVLTYTLPNLGDLIQRRSQGKIEYKSSTLSNSVEGTNLYNDGKSAIQRIISKGVGTFPAHDHAVHEWLIVLEGSFEYKTGRKVIKVLQYGYAYFAPQIKHEINFLEDTVLLAITVPAEESYPNGTAQ